MFVLFYIHDGSGDRCFVLYVLVLVSIVESGRGARGADEHGARGADERN